MFINVGNPFQATDKPSSDAIRGPVLESAPAIAGASLTAGRDFTNDFSIR